MSDNVYDVIIVGGGLSGLSTAHFLKKFAPEKSVLILEKESRVGGAIQTLNEEGFLAEWGPHGFLDNVAESKELLDDLAVEDSVQKAPLKQFVRYICRDGKLLLIPQTPPKILKSPILPFFSKVRFLGDFFVKPNPNEQTIAEWASHRFGKAILPIADIALTGTYAGDIERLSIDAAMPGLRNLEKDHGSVLRGAIKTQKAKKGSGGMPSMVSFKNGMEGLVQLLSRDLDIKSDCSVESIQKTERWTVSTSESEFICKNLVISTQINGALPLLSHFAAPPQKSVNEAIVYNLVLGFGDDVTIPFGFGYLAPKIEKRFALGTLFSIHMFPGRAPEKMNLIEVLIGGTRNPEHLSLSDDELFEKAFADIAELLELKSKPVFRRIIKPKIGIPQLEMGHLKLLAYRESLENEHRGLFINGFGWEGIGMNDMIKQAKQTAEKLLSESGFEMSPAEAKGIYF